MNYGNLIYNIKIDLFDLFRFVFLDFRNVFWCFGCVLYYKLLFIYLFILYFFIDTFTCYLPVV